MSNKNPRDYARVFVFKIFYFLAAIIVSATF